MKVKMIKIFYNLSNVFVYDFFLFQVLITTSYQGYNKRDLIVKLISRQLSLMRVCLIYCVTCRNI